MKLHLVLVSLLGAVAPGLSQTPIGTAVATWSLSPANSAAYGIAYDEASAPHRLYVADQNDNRIYVYEVGGAGLTELAASAIDTAALNPEFVHPRGLALGRYGGRTYLYAVTSNAPGPAGLSFDSRLWRIDLGAAGGAAADFVDLNLPLLPTRDREVFGLAYAGGRVYISYDTSGILDATAVSHGILRVKVYEAASPNDWWSRLRSGGLTLYAAAAVEAILPSSGRETPESGFTRAPAFGLAYMPLGGQGYLWGTSYHMFLYLAEAATGRGVFAFDSPGSRNIYGLTFGDGHLWAVDRVSGADQVHKIQVASNWTVPVQGPRSVRHIALRLVSRAVRAVPDMDCRHNFMKLPVNGTRPNQGVSAGLVTPTFGIVSTSERTYEPAGDSTTRQTYYETRYRGPAYVGSTRTSRYEADIWTSKYRHFVYPHRAVLSAPPDGDYTAEDLDVYSLCSAASYARFWAALEDDLDSEYGVALPANPWWLARSIVEFVREHYAYGQEGGTYHTAARKMDLLFDADPDNDLLSCSSSAFLMIGLLRSAGIPARWVGTTVQRSKIDTAAGGERNWDVDGDGLLERDEDIPDFSFHRWVEVWLGSDYGWQRFDPTPAELESGGKAPNSQWSLMALCSCGVSSKDLVMQVGSGRHNPFWEQWGEDQSYNACQRYEGADDTANWDSSWWNADRGGEVTREAVWSNACFVDVTAPAGGSFSHAGTLRVDWATSGRWDLDPTATVTVYLQRVSIDPMLGITSKIGGLVAKVTAVPYLLGTTNVSLAGVADGSWQVYVVKDGDPQTGGNTPTFRIVP